MSNQSNVTKSKIVRHLVRAEHEVNAGKGTQGYVWSQTDGYWRLLQCDTLNLN